MNIIKQKITARVFLQGRTIKSGHGSNLIKLECGHNVTCRASQKISSYKRCRACENGEPTTEHIQYFDECVEFAKVTRRAATRRDAELLSRIMGNPTP